MVSKAQNRATTKYKKANYKRVSLEIPKDQEKTLKAVAFVAGESVNGFLKRAIQNQIEADARNAGKPIDLYIAEAIEALREKERAKLAADQLEGAEDQIAPAEDQNTKAHEKPQEAAEAKESKHPMRI